MKNESAYIEGRNNIYSLFVNEQRSEKKTHNHQFNLVSANLFKFLPEIKFERHESIFKEIALHNQFSHFEQLHSETFDYVTYENLTTHCRQLLLNGPCVLSTFHFGSYRLFNTFLINNKIPYTIVIPKVILEREGETLRKIYSNGDLKEDSKFIEVESPALGLKMLRELKSGRSVFIYFDGYRGSGDLKNVNRDDSEQKISFLNQKIFARKGVAYLANAAKVPLITAISYRKNLEDIRLRFFDPVLPDKDMDKDKFAHKTTQMLYDMFAKFLKKYPGQWESWIYLHKSIDASYIDTNNYEKEDKKTDFNNYEKFSLNPLQYGLFQIEKDSYIFNKRSYTTYPIDDGIYNILLKSSKEYIIKNEFTTHLFEQLIKSSVLIPYKMAN